MVVFPPISRYLPVMIFYREGEADPFYSAIDETTGTKEVTWNVVDFDDDTMEFYFGTTEPAKGEIYEGVKAFVFDSKSGGSIAFARLKYVATLGGGINKTDPLQIQVSAKVFSSGTRWLFLVADYNSGIYQERFVNSLSRWKADDLHHVSRTGREQKQ